MYKAFIYQKFHDSQDFVNFDKISLEYRKRRRKTLTFLSTFIKDFISEHAYHGNSARLKANWKVLACCGGNLILRTVLGILKHPVTR